MGTSEQGLSNLSVQVLIEGEKAASMPDQLRGLSQR